MSPVVVSSGASSSFSIRDGAGGAITVEPGFPCWPFSAIYQAHYARERG